MAKETSREEQDLIEMLVEKQMKGRKTTIPVKDVEFGIVLTREVIEKIVDDKIQHLLADMTEEDLEKLILEVRSRKSKEEKEE